MAKTDILINFVVCYPCVLLYSVIYHIPSSATTSLFLFSQKWWEYEQLAILYNWRIEKAFFLYIRIRTRINLYCISLDDWTWPYYLDILEHFTQLMKKRGVITWSRSTKIKNKLLTLHIFRLIRPFSRVLNLCPSPILNITIK